LFVENGQPQTIFTVTLLTGVGGLAITVVALSDDVEAVVPEPSTFLLLSSGLLSIRLAARRRLRRS
jgi:PEP-CTERM motif